MSYQGLLGQEPSPAGRAQLEGQAAAQVQATLVTARAGKATLGQLGAAFELASKLNLPAARDELRSHILAAVEPPSGFGISFMKTAGVSIGLGIVAGMCTHFILTSIGQRRSAEATRRYAFSN